MTAIKAIYNGNNFEPLQPIPVNENYEVIITFIKPVETEPPNEIAIANDKDIEPIAARILEKHIKAFEELAK